MKVLYGPDYRMWIDSKPGEGTRTGIEIPDVQVGSRNRAGGFRRQAEVSETALSCKCRPVKQCYATSRKNPKPAIGPTPIKDTLYQDRVNPQWVRLLDVLQMNARYTRCEGTELFTDDGRRILDFLSGYCVHNLGHNHPAIY